MKRKIKNKQQIPAFKTEEEKKKWFKYWYEQEISKHEELSLKEFYNQYRILENQFEEKKKIIASLKNKKLNYAELYDKDEEARDTIRKLVSTLNK